FGVFRGSRAEGAALENREGRRGEHKKPLPVIRSFAEFEWKPSKCRDCFNGCRTRVLQDGPELNLNPIPTPKACLLRLGFVAANDVNTSITVCFWFLYVIVMTRSPFQRK